MGGPSQRVDKVDTLLDGDAGSRRLVILALLPLSPPVPPLHLKNSGNTRVSAISACQRRREQARGCSLLLEKKAGKKKEKKKGE